MREHDVGLAAGNQPRDAAGHGACGRCAGTDDRHVHADGQPVGRQLPAHGHGAPTRDAHGEPSFRRAVAWRQRRRRVRHDHPDRLRLVSGDIPASIAGSVCFRTQFYSETRYQPHCSNGSSKADRKTTDDPAEPADSAAIAIVIHAFWRRTAICLDPQTDEVQYWPQEGLRVSSGFRPPAMKTCGDFVA